MPTIPIASLANPSVRKQIMLAAQDRLYDWLAANDFPDGGVAFLNVKKVPPNVEIDLSGVADPTCFSGGVEFLPSAFEGNVPALMRALKQVIVAAIQA